MYSDKERRAVEQLLQTFSECVQCYENAEKHVKEQEIDWHFVLDAAGLIPGAGAVFDGINTAWYAVEGDWNNALLSGLAFVPGIGEAVGGEKTAVKAGGKIIGHMDEAADIAKAADKVEDAAKAAGKAGKTGKNVGEIGKYVDGAVEGGRKTGFNATPELEAHIKNIDTSVPRKRGIGGAHNSTEFFKNDVEIVSETPSKIPGVKTVEYKMSKLNADGTPTGEYGVRVFKKTIYNPDVISDDEFIKRGLEAANDSMSKLDDGVMQREWFGVDSKGIMWHGYFEDGEITSFFPDE